MRYLPLTAQDRQSMLAKIGVASVDDLYREVPAGLLYKEPMADLPLHQSEMAVERHLQGLAAQNISPAEAPCFIGAGAYRHHVPASVDALIQRGEFLTSYTPYQPEISQGTLQTLFEFQSQVCLLTGMEVANASMYDGATAASEAVLMACRITNRNAALLCGNLHPHYREVIGATACWTGRDIRTLPVAPEGQKITALKDALSDDLACVVVQTPDFLGHVQDYSDLATACAAKGILLVIVVTEIVSLGLLKSPGAQGADIVVAEGQSLGNPLSFGGPYLGLFATKQKYIRQMPGRLCGQSVDADCKRSFVLTLNTREQHIRREKATSNICTNSGLCALAFSIHLSLLGEQGYTHLSKLNHYMAQKLKAALAQAGLQVLNSNGYFNELVVDVKRDAAQVVEAMAAQHKILAGVPVSRLLPDEPQLGSLLLLAATELTTDDDIAQLVTALREVLA